MTPRDPAAGSDHEAELRVVEGLRGSHAGFVALVSSLSDRDARQPCLLPGWTRGMLIAHVISAGRAALRCADAARRGESVAMYPRGELQRDQEIDAGRERPTADLIPDLLDVCTSCDSAFASLPEDAWDVPMVSRRGPIPLSGVAIQRWLDVEAHRVDLGLGYGTEQWPVALVDVALPVAVRTLPALRHHPAADREVVGVWRLRRTDGEGDWSVHATADDAWLTGGEGSGCEIAASGQSLLALVIGREVKGPVAVEGDAHLAEQFKRAFPGP